MVLADPKGSILAEYIETGHLRKEVGSWMVEGIGEDFLPDVADLSRVRTAYELSDRESMLTARELLEREGILAGSSSGTLIAAALDRTSVVYGMILSVRVCLGGRRSLKKTKETI